MLLVGKWPLDWRCLQRHGAVWTVTRTPSSYNYLWLFHANNLVQKWYKPRMSNGCTPWEKNVYLDHSGLAGYPGKRYHQQANMLQTSGRFSHLGKSTFSLKVRILAGAGTIWPPESHVMESCRRHKSGILAGPLGIMCEKAVAEVN